MEKVTVNIYQAHKAIQLLHRSWNSFRTPIKLACFGISKF